ncbi:MAG: carbonic anhydrase family protein [Sterolibacteriaceae bacterium]|uniref:carbonic anhydrase n=1 Tax=Candidatus Methylophosphatis roskildensis TaxID=2899263 RepID=A0A9D7E494_9PROT|nr:carbonic anhydrase family protein [Candidatus Methylophosphatis roskildensis]
MRRIIPLLIAAAASLPTLAADWQNIASEKGARVDIDRASLLPSDPGKKIVWMRLVVAPDVAAREGYHTLKALNRYDCRANRYSTIKRVFLREDMTVMREERVEGERESAVQAGTTDAKLFREVCQPPTVGELKKVALQAAEAGQKAGTADAEVKKPLVDIRPTLRHADLKAEAEATRAAVGIDKHDAKPAAREESKPAGKSAPKPAVAKAEPGSHAVAPIRKPAVEAKPPRGIPDRHRPAAKEELALAGHAAPAKPVTAVTAVKAVDLLAKDSHSGTGHDVHWTYEGETGPDSWGTLKPEWKTCSTGERQSPIDIRDGIRVDQEPVRFYYKPSGFSVIDNGHTVQVRLTAGNRIIVMGREYELVQFHFHRPSEERVNGKLYEMVAHLVPKDREGRLAVVAVLLDKGPDNPIIQQLWNHLPLERNVEVPASSALDVEALLPQDRSYFSYMGSLTTPPCSEGVLWMVMREPVAVSAEQVAAFARLYSNNARPIQQAAGRVIKESR